MRTVPDVSALADPNLGGYEIGLTAEGGTDQGEFEDLTIGGTSLSSPLFAGFEADLIQGRGGRALGFANPLLYHSANTAAFHDVTGTPQGPGYAEAVIKGAADNNPLSLFSLGQCGTRSAPACGPGYNMATGLGSPGPAFFNSFGSQLR
jgi:subtilase family serine protease